MCWCVFADVPIVDRHHSPGGTYEIGYYPGEYRHYGPSYHLDLEMTDDQRAVASNQTVVGVGVPGKVYDMLQNRNTVRIYYERENPLTFLLEEEI